MTSPTEVCQITTRKPAGVRSKEANARSRCNAITHGIFSDIVVLPGESRSKYRALLEEFHKSQQPEGGVEDLLVEKLAIITWRYRRLLVAEGAEIRQGCESWEQEKKNRENDSGMIQKIEDPKIRTGCLEMLRELQNGIASSGFDRDRDTAILKVLYGPGVGFGKSLFTSYLKWFPAEGADEDRRRKGFATLDESMNGVRMEIEIEIQRLREYRGKHASIESGKTKEIEILCRSVPEPARLDRLLRYEVSLERAFDRTLNQIERMQRLRRGQPVAPRIDVNVSS